MEMLSAVIGSRGVDLLMGHKEQELAGPPTELELVGPLPVGPLTVCSGKILIVLQEAFLEVDQAGNPGED